MRVAPLAFSKMIFGTWRVNSFLDSQWGYKHRLSQHIFLGLIKLTSELSRTLLRCFEVVYGLQVNLSKSIFQVGNIPNVDNLANILVVLIRDGACMR